MFIFLNFLIQFTYAQVEFGPLKIHESKLNCNPLCSFNIQYQDYKVSYSETEVNFGTRMFASYKVDSLDRMEEFAVVQFVRGCQFSSEVKDGKTIYYDNIWREYFGKKIPFKHPNWVVDSVDTDPMYNNATSNFNFRHAIYRWNEIEGSFNPDTERKFFQAKPLNTTAYVVDRPGTAFIQNNIAKNISLEFKTCLYRTDEIPKELASGEEVDFAIPLSCHEWRSSFIYNHQKKQYESPVEVHERCL